VVMPSKSSWRWNRPATLDMTLLVRGVRAGNLRRAERGGLRNGSVDEGELLSAHAGGQKVGGVGDAKGVHVFEGGGEAGDLVVHILMSFRFLGIVLAIIRLLKVGARLFLSKAGAEVTRLILRLEPPYVGSYIGSYN